MINVKPLHVSTSVCHHQGVYWNKEYKFNTLNFVLIGKNRSLEY